MLKLKSKSIIMASIVAAAAIFSAGCFDSEAKPSGAISMTKPSIDGGVSYPIVNDKTGPYYVNTKAIAMKINYGRLPTANELKAWDTGVMPDGTGLPEGSGTADEGGEIYDEN